MKNYEEFNDFRMKDSNEKFKKKKKVTKIKPQEIKTKFNEFDRQKEEIEKEESRKNFIKKNMNQYINGFSAFD